MGEVPGPQGVLSKGSQLLFLRQLWRCTAQLGFQKELAAPWQGAQ